MTPHYFTFGLIVTGEGEEQFLPELFRDLMASGTCSFRVLRRIGQRSPRTSTARTPRMVGSAQKLPSNDDLEIGLPARHFIREGEGRFVLLVDDLEHARRPDKHAVFQRYRLALDAVLGPDFTRGSVHFLVNMLEAYYFADALAVAAALASAGLAAHALAPHAGDVEEIRHPKNQLKMLIPGFDEKKHGAIAVAALDLQRVLARPDTCASLRTLVAWCCKQMGRPRSQVYGLSDGIFDVVTGRQLADHLASSA